MPLRLILTRASTMTSTISRSPKPCLRSQDSPRRARSLRGSTGVAVQYDRSWREVTDASKEDEEGEERVGHGTGVVCFLYKDGSVENLWYFLT